MKATKTASGLLGRASAASLPGITTKPLWFVLPTVLVLLYVWTLTDFPLDYWHHLNAGRQMTDGGTLATTEIFSHTATGRTVVNQNWLVQLGAYHLHKLGGFALLQAIAGVGYALAFAVTVALAARRCGNMRIAGLTTAGTLVLAVANFGIRPQALSTALFAIELYALWCWPGKRRVIVVVAIVEILWTNTHGAFPLGVVLPGIFATAAIWTNLRCGGGHKTFSNPVVQVYIACILVGSVVMFCNPFPSRTAEYVLGVMSNSSQRQIGEWLPTSFDSISGKAFFGSLAASLVVLGLSRRRLDATELLLLVSFMLLAATAQRMVIWWAIVMIPILVRHAVTVGGGRFWTEEDDGRSPVNLLFAIGLIVMLAWSTPWTRAANGLLPAAKRMTRPIDEPRGVVTFLKETNYRGNMLNTMSWGAYLTWHLDPQAKVFVDGRMEVFPDDVWHDFVGIGRLQGDWQSKMDAYQIDLVVWNLKQSNALPLALNASDAWRQVYRDQIAVVFARVNKTLEGTTSHSPVRFQMPKHNTYDRNAYKHRLHAPAQQTQAAFRFVGRY